MARAGATARTLATRHDIDLVPLRGVFRGYGGKQAQADLHAAVNVALLAFPQGMAYALLAGLPVSFGLLCAGLAAIAGPLWSRSAYLVHGPTNATAVMLLGAGMFATGEAREFSTFVLVVGAMLAVSAFLKIDGLIKYVSRTVVVGYLTAAALLIIVNQMHHLLGVRMAGAESASEMIMRTVALAQGVQWGAVGVSVVSVLVWWKVAPMMRRIPRVLLTLVAGILTAQAFEWGAGWPTPMLDAAPPEHFSGRAPALDPDSVYRAIPPAFAVALLAVLETTALARGAAARTGRRVRVNQELFATGMANVACAFFPAMAASASPTRTALNRDSGAATQLASVYSGLMVLGASAAVGPLLRHIPVAALAVVVIFSAVQLIDLRHLRTVFRSTRSDAVVLVLTLVTGLVAPLSVAVYLGVAVSLVLYLRKAGQPELVEFTFDEQGQLRAAGSAEARPDPQISIIHVEGELFLGASDLFEEQIRRVCADPQIRVVILRMKNARHLDATCVLALEELLRFLRETDRHLIIDGATGEVRSVLNQSGFLANLGEANFFLTRDDNPNLSTRNALKRAQELMGSARAAVRIFHAAERRGPEPGDAYEI